MSGSVRRYCACRDPQTGKQLGTTCPKRSHSSHGKWQYVISTPSPDGKRRQVRKSGFSTRKEATAALAEVAKQVHSGDYRDDAKQTVEDYLTAWLTRQLEDGLRASTARGYRSYIHNDMIPTLGRVRLGALTPSHVDTFIRTLRKDGRGTTTIRRIHAVLRSALSDAKKRRLVTYNAAIDVEIPADDSGFVTPWETHELSAFLDQATTHRLVAIYEVLAFAGLRRGEACALRWSDVDLTTGVITVRTNLVNVGGKIVEGRPKTRRGERRVDVGQRTIGALLVHKLAQDAERDYVGTGWMGTTDRIFTRPDGSDLSPEYVSTVFKRLTQQVRFPDDVDKPDDERRRLRQIRLHDLRHGAASMALAAGFDIATVSKRLGHSTISITADTYSHLLAGVGRNMADSVENLVSQNGECDNSVTTTHQKGP